MSLHRYTTTQGDKKVVVTLGWDRPLQGFFMTIVESASKSSTVVTHDDQEDDETFLFNSLEQQNPYPKEINGYLAELEHHGVELPEQMVDEVLSDGMKNVGNKYVEHTIENSRYVRNPML